MGTSDWIALFAAVVALASVVLHLVLRAADRRDARHTSVITALQGEKEAVGYEAYRLAEGNWPDGVAERKQLRDALCLAFVFERSDRTRALIYRALHESPEGERANVRDSLSTLAAMFADAEQHEVDWDLHRAWDRLAMLGRLLDFPDVTEVARAHLRDGTERRDGPSRTA